MHAWHDIVGSALGEGDVWIFAYGSLMWDPGFAYVEAQPATLHGYHRQFCIYSYAYRGTPERPGLVLGLDRGGSCRARLRGRNTAGLSSGPSSGSASSA